MGGAEAIPPFLTYLCLDDASYINGHVFGVEGRRIGLRIRPFEERILYHDYDGRGAITLEEIQRMAPIAFPVANSWPALAEEELQALLAQIDPGFR